MTFRIPDKGKFSQPNKGDVFGNIHRTTNIDFDTNPGKLRISPRLTLNTKDDDSGISGMGVPMAFVNHIKSSTHQFYAACGIGAQAADGTGKILVSSSDSPTSGFTNDASTNTPTDVHAAYSDMVEWADGADVANGLGPSIFLSTYASSTSKIKKLFNNDGWKPSWFTTSAGVGGGAGGSFSVSGMKNLGVGANGNLYFTDDDKIGYVPFATSTSSQAAVQSGTGTLNFYKKYRPIWFRSTSTTNIIGLMTFDAGTGSKGYVALWDGTGTAPQRIIDIAAPCPLSCTVVDDIPYIIDAYGRLKKYSGTNFYEVARLPVANQNIEMPGIYNDSINNRWIAQRGMDVVDGKININVNNFVSTGVYVEDMPSGVWEYDPSRPELGLYHKNSPCADSNDYGQQAILSAGAIYGTKRSTTNYIVGYGYYVDDATTSHNGIFYDDVATNTNKHGIVVTPFLTSPAIRDTWSDVVYRHRRLESGDKFIGKYRNYKNANMPFTASMTWTSTTTFTSTDSNFQYVSGGEEIEVIMGKGASTTAHVSSISVNAGTYTVTLDEAIGFSSGTGKVRVDNFTKLGTMTDLYASETSMPPLTTDTKIQIKTEYRVDGDFELDDLTITNTKQQ